MLELFFLLAVAAFAAASSGNYDSGPSLKVIKECREAVKEFEEAVLQKQETMRRLKEKYEKTNPEKWKEILRRDDELMAEAAQAMLDNSKR